MATILFADDEPQYVRVYGEALERQGHQPLYARNVKDAQARLDAQPIHLLVLDIMMPYESVRSLLQRGVAALVEAPEKEVRAGIYLYRWLQERHPGIPVVVLSVLSEDTIRELAQEADPPVEMGCPMLLKGQDPDHALRVLRGAIGESTTEEAR